MMNNKGFRKIVLAVMAGALALSAAAAIFSGCNSGSSDNDNRPRPSNERSVDPETQGTGE